MNRELAMEIFNKIIDKCKIREIGLTGSLDKTEPKGFDIVINETLYLSQLHMKFATDFFVGFFTGIFAVIGIHYIRQKGEVKMKQLNRVIGYIHHIQEIAPLNKLPLPLRVMAAILVLPLAFLGIVMMIAGS